MHKECWKRLTNPIECSYAHDFVGLRRALYLFSFVYFTERETFFVMNRNVLSFRILFN